MSVEAGESVAMRVVFVVRCVVKCFSFENGFGCVVVQDNELFVQ